MSKKANFLLISLLLAIGVFTYLSIHHYQIKTGLAGDESICSISSKVNCDLAATSSFSELFNIPIAVWGAVFHLILFSFILFYKLGWSDDSIYLRFTTRFMLGSAAAVSIIMAGISIFAVKAACPFCIATYVLSFISLFLGWNLITPDTKESINFGSYLNEYKSHLIALICVPALSWVVSGMALNHYGLDEMLKYVPEKLAVWQNSAVQNLDPNLGISNKVTNPKHTLVEYADFKCPHCKMASQTIGRFLNTRTDILFIFKPYPLDGNCNANAGPKGDGSRCAFAAYALCSEKIAQKGLDVTHWLFDNQQEFSSITDGKTLLPRIQEKFGIDPKVLGECADSAETYDALTKSTQEGNLAGVEGTPTIYLDGKKLPWGHVPEVLRQATK